MSIQGINILLITLLIAFMLITCYYLYQYAKKKKSSAQKPLLIFATLTLLFAGQVKALDYIKTKYTIANEIPFSELPQIIKNSPADGIHSKTQFNTLINTTKPYVVVYYSQTCMYCHMAYKPLKALTDDFGKRGLQVQYVHAPSDIGQELKNKYSIPGTPSIVYVNGDKHEVINAWANDTQTLSPKVLELLNKAEKGL